ncbi:hypothetical protein [Achromobacter denitrificans]|uniref:hypothetical protein n=1 Tax=Achromobacter denitrificans TaxID=32002 RepID=UPI003B9ABE60
MMICERCGRAGIRWMGPFSNLTHTECPHCGGTNCQMPDGLREDDEDVQDLMDRDMGD